MPGDGGQGVINLSQLTGAEVKEVAEALAGGNLAALLKNKEQIINLGTDELRKLVDVGAATRANCGGFGCG